MEINGCRAETVKRLIKALASAYAAVPLDGAGLGLLSAHDPQSARLGVRGPSRRIGRRNHRIVHGQAEILAVALRGVPIGGEVPSEHSVGSAVQKGDDPVF